MLRIALRHGLLAVALAMAVALLWYSHGNAGPSAGDKYAVTFVDANGGLVTLEAMVVPGADPVAVRAELVELYGSDEEQAFSFTGFTKPSPSHFAYNPDGQHAAIAGASASLAYAAAAWRVSSAFEYEFDGLTDRVSTRCTGGIDGANTITWGLLGQSSILAISCSSDMQEWDVMFNGNASWGSIDFKTVAMHELGHSLGLGHTDVPGALMLPIYHGPMAGPEADDVAGLFALYGGDPIGPTPTVTATATSTPTPTVSVTPTATATPTPPIGAAPPITLAFRWNVLVPEVSFLTAGFVAQHPCVSVIYHPVVVNGVGTYEWLKPRQPLGSTLGPVMNAGEVYYLFCRESFMDKDALVLYPGWNLASGDATPTFLLDLVYPSVDFVYEWDDQSATWRHWIRGVPDFVNAGGVSELSIGEAYWIHSE